MAWYAYCISEQQAFPFGARARRPYPIDGLKGIGGAQVMVYPSGEFAIIVSEYVRSGDLNQEAIRHHAQVITECFRHGTVLPFRFGSVFETEDALRRAVRSNRRTFTESVSNLRGKSEMHLKVVVYDGAIPELVAASALPPTVGSEYLSQLRQRAARQRERQTKARALSVQVHKLFNPLQEDVSCKKVESGALLLEVAHLIDSRSVDKYQNRFTNATKQLKNCEMVISGPWPPFHFMPDKLRMVSQN
jgi:hypothetical protein